MKKLLANIIATLPLFSFSQTPIGTVIGHTTYDLQANSADPQRIVLRSNGHIAVTWTGAVDLGKQR